MVIETDNLKLEKVPNCIVLSEIEISDCGRKFLEVHYKCRENRKQNNVDTEVEIIKMGIKNRYEKMSQGDLIEDLPESESRRERQKETEELNRKILKNSDVNYTKIRLTELTFNTRTHPPCEATVKSGAAIRNQEDIARDCFRVFYKQNPYCSVLSEEETKGKDTLAKRIKNEAILLTLKRTPESVSVLLTNIVQQQRRTLLRMRKLAGTMYQR